MNDFLKSDEFRRYHNKVLMLCAKTALGHMDKGEMAQAQGAYQLAKKIIALPGTIGTDDAVKIMVKENVQGLRASFIKEAMRKE